jgi:hypothetical protein
LQLDRHDAKRLCCPGKGLLVVFALVAEEFAGFGDLVAVVEVFNGLLEADGNEKAEDDGGDVDEEVAPAGGGVMGRVDVEHGCGFFRRGCGRFGGIRWRQRDGVWQRHRWAAKSVSRVGAKTVRWRECHSSTPTSKRLLAGNPGMR